MTDCSAPRLLQLEAKLRDWLHGNDGFDRGYIAAGTVIKEAADELSALVREQEPPQVECPNCEGDGFAPGGGNCPRCHGGGKVAGVELKSQNPPRRARHDSADWVDRLAADIRDLNPDFHDFEGEVANFIRAALVRETPCGVVGEPEAGRKVCELPAGHEGYHQQGSVRWLGYSPPPPSQQLEECKHVWVKHTIIDNVADEPVSGRVCGRCRYFEPSPPSQSAQERSK